MNKLFFFLFLYLLLINSSFTQPRFGGGYGIKTEPFVIDNLDHLKELSDSVALRDVNWSHDKWFIQTDDIRDEANFIIGTNNNRFKGYYNGNGFNVILNIDYETGFFCGLFNTFYENTSIDLTPSEITNVIVSGLFHSVTHIQGGVVGFLNTTTRVMRLTNCINNSQVYNLNPVMNARSGGIIGLCNTNGMTNVIINNCLNLGTIYGVLVGGIVGTNDASMTMNNCINAGSIIGITTAGGIIGRSNSLHNHFDSYYNCINSAVIRGTQPNTNLGCIIADPGNGSIIDCYWDQQTCPYEK